MSIGKQNSEEKSYPKKQFASALRTNSHSAARMKYIGTRDVGYLDQYLKDKHKMKIINSRENVFYAEAINGYEKFEGITFC